MTPADVVSTLLEVRKAAVVRAAVELQVFDHLAGDPVDSRALAAAARIDPRGAGVLLGALAAIGILTTDGGRFRLREELVKPLVSGHDSTEFIGAVVRLGSPDLEWQALGRLAEAVRNGGSVLPENLDTPECPYLEEWAEHAAWGSDTVELAELVADRLGPWARSRPALDVLDLACGPGWYGYVIADGDERAKVSCVDRPHVLSYTEENMREFIVEGRAQLIAGDMFETPLGGPHDVVVIAGILHHFSVEMVSKLLRRVHAVLKPDGRLVIVAPVVDEADPAADVRAHLFSVAMLALTAQGQVHSLTGYTGMLEAAGFTEPEVHSKDGSSMRVLIAARRSGDGVANTN